MKEHFQLFCAPMVRAILDGRKSQTRRLVSPDNSLIDGLSARTRAGKALWAKLDWERAKPYASMGAFEDAAPVDAWWVPEIDLPDDSGHSIDPYVRTGDVLIGKETFRVSIGGAPGTPADGTRLVYFRADEDEAAMGNTKWRPSIFMPKWASRLRLEVTATFPQRLQDISAEDCLREGIHFLADLDGYASDDDGRHFHGSDPRRSYEYLWTALNGDGAVGWNANPPVWARVFRLVEIHDEEHEG